MSDERYENGFQPEDEKPVDYKALFFEYLMYWPWILGCVIVMGMVMYAYLRYQAPVYNVNATVLIKQGDQTKSPSASPMQAMQDLGMLSMASNFDNEMEILRSRTLVKKVVNKLNLYINYKEAQTFRYPADLYKTSPVQVWTTPEEADRLFGPVTLEMTCTPDGKVEVEGSYYPSRNADKVTLRKHFDQLPGVLTTPVGVFTLSANSDSTLTQIDQTRTITATVVAPTALAGAYANNLTSEPTSKTTTIAALSLDESNPTRGVDFINMLVALYNEDANNDKNEVAAKTAQFIDERIGIINQELGTTESQLASFKQRAGVVDIAADATQAAGEQASYERAYAENEVQISLVNHLKNHILNESSQYEVIPANIGLNNSDLNTVVQNYNQMLIERKRLLRTSHEDNPAVQSLNASIEVMRNSVMGAIQTAEKGWLMQPAKALFIDQQ
jgi:uncharacterized protein involved in exopolysaccharide biosynthesis